MSSFDFEQVNRIYCFCSLPTQNRLSIWAILCGLPGNNRLLSPSLLLGSDLVSWRFRYKREKEGAGSFSVWVYPELALLNSHLAFAASAGGACLDFRWQPPDSPLEVPAENLLWLGSSGAKYITQIHFKYCDGLLQTISVTNCMNCSHPQKHESAKSLFCTLSEPTF